MKGMSTDVTDHGFGASQDISGYVDYAKEMREGIYTGTTAYKSFCIIPDIVAIDIHIKHKIDVHDDEQIHDPATWRKVKGIIRSEYPYLLTGGISNRFNIGGL